MSDFMSLIGAIGAGEAPRIGEKVEVNGVTVSTVNSYDMGYETAICDENSCYPVERYETKEEAVKGHEKWIKEAETLETVTQLGYGDFIGDEEVTLHRAPTDREG